MKVPYFILSLVMLLCSHSLSAQQTAAIEREHILSIGLMAYVYANWQANENSSRGYNIGALLFDPLQNSVIGWNLNSVRESSVGKTAHAEVGLMQGLIREKLIGKNLNGFYIITTLEPCMMCSGMMTFLGADSVKYIQTDPEFGKNIERLAADYAGQPANERCKHIKSVRAVSGNYGSALENLYSAFRSEPQNQNKSMAEFLYESAVMDIYKAAWDELQGKEVQFSENTSLLSQVKEFLNKK